MNGSATIPGPPPTGQAPEKPDRESMPWQEIRCRCGRLLFRVLILEPAVGVEFGVETVCSKGCKSLVLWLSSGEMRFTQRRERKESHMMTDNTS
ncbi:MAG: hypothetical protein WC485_02830 [Opitutaceae bacterium]